MDMLEHVRSACKAVAAQAGATTRNRKNRLRSVRRSFRTRDKVRYLVDDTPTYSTHICKLIK